MTAALMLTGLVACNDKKDVAESEKVTIGTIAGPETELMEAAKYCSLGQITKALFEVGGQYRRNM